MTPPKVVPRGGAYQTITLTITAQEATMQRLATLLLFAHRPGDDEFKKALDAMPWENPGGNLTHDEEPERGHVTETLREQATEAIQNMCDTWALGHKVVLSTLASFGATRLRDLPEDKLILFIDALNRAPVDGRENPDDLI